MSYVICLPFVYEPYFDACMATIDWSLREHMLLIDNTQTNIGIMAAHNLGIDEMRRRNADWLVIMSAAVRFGPTGGRDFMQLLEDHSDYYVIHAASENVVGGKWFESEEHGHNEVFGWHLTAFRNHVFDNVGRWDENFTPYGLDDIDLSLRLQKHYKHAPGWDTLPCDVHDTTMAHSINFGGVESPYAPKAEYFTEKWGRTPDDWQNMGYEHPFNDPNNTLAYWPSASNGGRWDA